MNRPRTIIPTPAITPALVTASLLFLLAAGLARPASAHGGEGKLTVEVAEQMDVTTFRFEVRLVYAGDDHGVPDATVTVAGDGPGGALAPVTMDMVSAEEGRYVGLVTFPDAGAWKLRFSSVEPPATAEITQEVGGGAPVTTVPSPSTTVPNGSTTGGPSSTVAPGPSTTVAATTGGTGGTTPAPSSVVPSNVPTSAVTSTSMVATSTTDPTSTVPMTDAGADGQSGDDGGTPWWAVAVAAIAAIGAVILVLGRRRNAMAGDAADPTGGSGGGAQP